MLIDDLIEKLYELKREYGSQEVTLYTQRDAWSWEEYDVGAEMADQETRDGRMV